MYFPTEELNIMITLKELSEQYQDITLRFWYKVFEPKYLRKDLEPFIKKRGNSILINFAGIKPILDFVADQKRQGSNVDQITIMTRKYLVESGYQGGNVGMEDHVNTHANIENHQKPINPNDDIWERLLAAETARAIAEERVGRLEERQKLLEDSKAIQDRLKAEKDARRRLEDANQRQAEEVRIRREKEVAQQKTLLWEQHDQLAWWNRGRKKALLNEIRTFDMNIFREGILKDAA